MPTLCSQSSIWDSLIQKIGIFWDFIDRNIFFEYFCSTAEILNGIFRQTSLKCPEQTEVTNILIILMLPIYSWGRFSSEHCPHICIHMNIYIYIAVKNGCYIRFYQNFGIWRHNTDQFRTLVPNSRPR